MDSKLPKSPIGMTQNGKYIYAEDVEQLLADFENLKVLVTRLVAKHGL